MPGPFHLPADVREGDFIEIGMLGAYGVAMNTRFNGYGDTELAEYLKTLMRPELQEGIAWWDENDDAVTPLDESDENPYLVEDFSEAYDLEQEADAPPADPDQQAKGHNDEGDR